MYPSERRKVGTEVLK